MATSAPRAGACCGKRNSSARARSVCVAVLGVAGALGGAPDIARQAVFRLRVLFVGTRGRSPAAMQASTHGGCKWLNGRLSATERGGQGRNRSLGGGRCERWARYALPSVRRYGHLSQTSVGPVYSGDCDRAAAYKPVRQLPMTCHCRRYHSRACRATFAVTSAATACRQHRFQDCSGIGSIE